MEPFTSLLELGMRCFSFLPTPQSKFSSGIFFAKHKCEDDKAFRCYDGNEFDTRQEFKGTERSRRVRD
jgi:hypothetical protein